MGARFVGNRRQRGLTLLEVTLAMGLAAMLLLGLFSLESASLSVRSDARERDLAREAARGQLEQILATEFSSIQPIYAPPSGFTFDVEGLKAEQGALPGRVVIDGSTAPASPTLLKVTVDVRWQGALGNESLELGTFVADQG